MGLKEERGEILTKYLTDDIERAKKLFNLPLKKALVKINSDGFDFTEDELKDYAEYISGSFSRTSGDISESEMRRINGGGHIECAINIGSPFDFALSLRWAEK